MVDYRSTENHKTELQWLAEGFVLNETPSGTTEWNNRFHTFRVTRYSDHDVHEDPEKALSLLKEHRQTMKSKGAKKNKSRQERQIYTRIVGVTFINDETGENRQSIMFFKRAVWGDVYCFEHLVAYLISVENVPPFIPSDTFQNDPAPSPYPVQEATGKPP